MKETGPRILDAALHVFAREGVSGATTRAIAHAAGVNEVTLFRHFRNKEELLRQVVLQCSRQYEDQLGDASFETQADLRRAVRIFARAYSQKLHEHEDLIRTFLGELRRHEKLCRRLFVESSRTMRHRLIEYLRAARKRGLVRKNLDAATAADALTGMLLIGMIRSPLTGSLYTRARYVKTCLELFLKGIEP